MLPLVVAQPKLKKGTAPAGVIRGLADSLHEFGFPCAGVYFQFAHDSDAVLERMVKQFPLLGSFRRAAAEGPNPQVAALTNLAVDPETSRLVPPMPLTSELVEGLSAVAEGVPRRFPVQQLTVIFAEIDWGQGWITALPDEYVLRNDRMPPMFAAMTRFTSSIAYSNMWWVSGRKQSLDIKLIGAPLGFEGKAPPVPEKVLAAIARVTPVTAKSFSMIPMNSTAPAATPFTAEQQRRCLELTRDASASLQARVDDKRLPHPLFADSSTQLGAERETGIPKKEIIAAALRPLGFKHSGKLGGQGMMGFVKTTAKNTRLSLEFDFGTWLPRIDEPMLQISGASWSQLVKIPFHEGTGSFPVTTQADFEHAIANIASQLEELERSYLSQLETLMGESPKWTAAGH